jgi:hypothetical protein
MQHSDIDPGALKPALADYVLDYADTIPDRGGDKLLEE